MAVVALMASCGGKTTSESQTESVEVEEVEVDSTTLEGNFDDDSIEQVEESSEIVAEEAPVVE